MVDILKGIFCLFLLLSIYFFPTTLAVNRKHDYRLSIFIVNIFFGWTLVGWVVLLAWAASPRTKRIQYVETYSSNFQRGSHPQTSPPFPFRDKASFTDEQLASLEKLGRLRKEGILNEEEFTQAKEKILKSNG